MIVTDRDGNVQLANKMAEALVAASREELLGRPLVTIMRPLRGWDGLLEELVAALKQGREIVWPDEKVVFPFGEERTVRAQFSPLFDNGAGYCGSVVTVQDITEVTREIENLRVEQVFLDSLLNNVRDTIYFKDTQGRFTRINHAQAEMLGLKSPEEGIGKTDFDFFTPEHAKAAWEDEQRIIRTGLPLLDKTELVRRADGQYRWVSASKVPIRDRNGRITGIVGISRDITERKLVEEELTYLNFHDKLTGLYNRAYFEEELRRLDVPRMLPLSIIVGDLNGLKVINDAFGHDAGDRLLQSVARILKSCCRQEDMVARWGGDEFVILLPKTDRCAADNVCERIRRKFEEEKWEYVRPGISLGVATKTNPDQDVAQMFREADQAMYRDKLMENRSTRQLLIASLKKAMGGRMSLNEVNWQSLLTLLARMVEIVDTYIDITGEGGNQAVAVKALSELARCLRSEYDVGAVHPSAP